MMIDYDSTFDKIQGLYKNSSGEVHKAYSKCLDVISEMPEVDAEPVKRGEWVVSWKCHNYHEMDSGVYAYQYSECMVHVTCSICGSDSGSFKWDKSGKGKAGLDGLAYKMQVAEMNALKTKFCPHCGALMRD